MTLLSPLFLVGALVAAGAAVALHFISTREPRVEVLPTARFIPEAPLTARARTARLSDRALLLLRVLLILVAGTALAQPVWTATRQPVLRIVVVDVSSAVADAAELADSTAVWSAPAAAVIAAGSGIRTLSGSVHDSVRALAAAADPSAAPVSLSSMLVAARRAAARHRDAADSLELVLVSPFTADQWDAATGAIRQSWPGSITTVRVAAALADTAATAARARVEWADSGAVADWERRAVSDTVHAIRAGDAVLVHAFERAWRLRHEDARVIARWIDGEAAGIERVDGDDCVRSFGFAIPDAGDIALSPSFARFLDGLDAPCGGATRGRPLRAAALDSLVGPPGLAAAGDIARADARATPLMMWLLVLCVPLVAAEQLLRRLA